jgi:hypothetical protein
MPGLLLFIIILYFKIYSRLLVVSWRSLGKSTSQPEIKGIYPKNDVCSAH